MYVLQTGDGYVHPPRGCEAAKWEELGSSITPWRKHPTAQDK